MGRASRWLKSLFVFKKDSVEERPNVAGICHNPTTIPPNLSPIEAAWLRSFYIETEKEQSKHAIAVAAATAAAADAAIVAANAAVAVVKLTANGRGKAAVESVSAVLKSCRESYAAVRIQSVFRGYLARKALRALRSLVKIQAVVRGFLVRKQAAATLKGMQALVRAQATVLSRRVGIRDSTFSGEFATRGSLDMLETRSVHSRRYSSMFESSMDGRTKIVEMEMSERPRSRPTSRSRRNSLSIYESVTKDQSHYYSTRLSPFSHHSDWGLNADEYKFPTAQSTPKYSAKRSSSLWTLTNPNYMANTQSFRAKLRSHSAPRQRSSDGGEVKRRMSLLEMMEGRKSTSQSSPMSFKNTVMRKIDGSRDESDKRRNGSNYKNVVGR